MKQHPMVPALQAWLQSAAAHQKPILAAQAAAEALAHDPWGVVRFAGTLARTELRTAPKDIGLTVDLHVKKPGHAQAVVTVAKGAPFPSWDALGKRNRGAFDTPKTMAQDTVRSAMNAATISVQSGLDPACGTGAFLVALNDAGVRSISGFELDPRAAVVAQIAAPQAKIETGDGFTLPGTADIIVGNPPFVPPERQNKNLRSQLRERYPWLRGRFDLAVPFAYSAVERAHEGGGIGLILPASLMVQPYAIPMRRRWLENHHIRSISEHTPFPGAAVQVVCLSMTKGTGPAQVPNHGLCASSLLRLKSAPLHPGLRPGDPELIDRIRTLSIPLGELATIDTGVVSHGSKGGKAALIHDAPTPERVPYVDARDLVENRTRWLDYQPKHMHRSKSPALFEAPKVLVQRLRGKGPVRAWVDHSGLYAGHTLTVIRPDVDTITPEIILTLITDPMIDGIIRMEHGSRLDLYPKDVRGIPVPIAWKQQPQMPLMEAWSLDQSEVERLSGFRLE